LFERSAKRSLEPAINIVPQRTPEGGRFIITAPAFRILEANGIKALRYYWSAHTRTIGLKAADPKDLNAYKVTPHARGFGAVCSAGMFLDHIGWIAPERVTLLVRWNAADHMFECELPAEHLRDSKQPRRVPTKALRAGGEGSG
jgi:hypothetical protein